MTRRPVGGPWACIWSRPRTPAAFWAQRPCLPCGSIRAAAVGTSWPARACWQPTCPQAREQRRGFACGPARKAHGSRKSCRATITLGTRTRIRMGWTTPSRGRCGWACRRRAEICWRRGARRSANDPLRPRGWRGRARIGRAQADGAGGGSVRTRLNSQRPPPKSRSSERIEARLSVASAVTAISVGPRTEANFPSML